MVTNMQIHPEWKQDAARLLQQLEAHWHPHYRPEELRRRLIELLLAVREALARDSADARFVVATYRRILKDEACEAERLQANEALKRLLEELGLVVIGIMPFSFVTLPGVFALARHFHIDLLPGERPPPSPPDSGEED